MTIDETEKRPRTEKRRDDRAHGHLPRVIERRIGRPVDEQVEVEGIAGVCAQQGNHRHVGGRVVIVRLVVAGSVVEHGARGGAAGGRHRQIEREIRLVHAARLLVQDAEAVLECHESGEREQHDFVAVALQETARHVGCLV